MATNTGGSARKWKPAHVRRLIVRKERLHKGLTRVSQFLMYISLLYALLKSAVNVIFHFKDDNDVKGDDQEITTICAGIVTLLWPFFGHPRSQQQAEKRKKKENLANDIAAAVEAATDDGDSLAAWKALALLATLNKKPTPQTRNSFLFSFTSMWPINYFEVKYYSANDAINYISYTFIRQPYFRSSRERNCVPLILISIMAFGLVSIIIAFVKGFMPSKWFEPPFYLLFMFLFSYEMTATLCHERDVEVLAEDLYHIVTAHAHAELVCDTAVCCEVSLTSNQLCQDDANHAE